jgi:hypothetical protein
MELTLRTLEGTAVVPGLQPSTSVHQLKQLIYDAGSSGKIGLENVPRPEKQRLVRPHKPAAGRPARLAPPPPGAPPPRPPPPRRVAARARSTATRAPRRRRSTWTRCWTRAAWETPASRRTTRWCCSPCRSCPRRRPRTPRRCAAAPPGAAGDDAAAAAPARRSWRRSRPDAVVCAPAAACRCPPRPASRPPSPRRPGPGGQRPPTHPPPAAPSLRPLPAAASRLRPCCSRSAPATRTPAAQPSRSRSPSPQGHRGPAARGGARAAPLQLRPGRAGRAGRRPGRHGQPAAAAAGGAGGAAQPAGGLQGQPGPPGCAERGWRLRGRADEAAPGAACCRCSRRPQPAPPQRALPPVRREAQGATTLTWVRGRAAETAAAASFRQLLAARWQQPFTRAARCPRRGAHARGAGGGPVAQRPGGPCRRRRAAAGDGAAAHGAAPAARAHRPRPAAAAGACPAAAGASPAGPHPSPPCRVRSASRLPLRAPTHPPSARRRPPPLTPLSPSPSPPPPLSRAPRQVPEPSAQGIAQLAEMGFSEALARKALLLCRNNVDAALEWVLGHMEDEDAEAPPTEAQLRQVRAGAAARPRLGAGVWRACLGAAVQGGAGNQPAGAGSDAAACAGPQPAALPPRPSRAAAGVRPPAAPQRRGAGQPAGGHGV